MSKRQSPRVGRDFERQLLRKSVDALAAGASRCADCHRTPLVGELVYSYSGGRIVCDLCRSRHREAPEGVRRVRSGEIGSAVRVSVRAA